MSPYAYLCIGMGYMFISDTFYFSICRYAEFDFQELSNPRRGVAIALWFIYLLLANLLLLNLLIAQFSSTYEGVYKDSYAVTVKK
jgi:hypothetical protein